MLSLLSAEQKVSKIKKENPESGVISLLERRIKKLKESHETTALDVMEICVEVHREERRLAS